MFSHFLTKHFRGFTCRSSHPITICLCCYRTLRGGSDRFRYDVQRLRLQLHAGPDVDPHDAEVGGRRPGCHQPEDAHLPPVRPGRQVPLVRIHCQVSSAITVMNLTLLGESVASALLTLLEVRVTSES